MIRSFQEHRTRFTRLLDGMWQFVTDAEQIGEKEQWAECFPLHNRTMAVPSCWNNELGLYDYEGAAWYRTNVGIRGKTNIRLLFHGVQGQADVYWNGEAIASHYGGFSPFEVVLPNVEEGSHALVVRADNTHNQQTIPLERVDWFHYGGISRAVELQEVTDVYIKKVKVEYSLDKSRENASIKAKVMLRSLASAPMEVPLELSLDGIVRYSETVTVPALAEWEHAVQFTEPNVRLWNVGKPELYIVYVTAGEDDWTDRIGFRTLEVSDGQVRINGEPVYLQGVNRHEEHPEWGFAFPGKLMLKDLDIIEKLGCNSIRGSHYPNSKLFMDLLDERGIAFWNEIPLWQYHPQHMSDPVVRTRAVAMLEEMIDRDMHHASTIFWSVNNECATDTEEGLDFNRMLVNRVRELDTSRLVTFATDRPLKDITLSLYDVIGINKYYGWYGGKVEGFAQFLEDYHAYAESQGVGNTPIIMGEFGGAGIFGDVGWEEERMFSEDYQAHILEKALHIFRNDPKVVGTYIWQFADVRSDTPRFRDRARGFNNKGIVNEYRKPKQAYRTVKGIYNS